MVPTFVLGLVVTALQGGADEKYVPLLSKQFIPARGAENFYARHARDRKEASAWCSSFVALPTSGAGFKAIAGGDLLWGRPELVYSFMSAARRWSTAGGRDIQVYALSPKNIVEHRIDNAEGTFVESHIHGSRDSQYRTWFRDDSGDYVHISGCSMDIREFTSSKTNEKLTRTIEKERELKAEWIYDMMTLEEIAEDDRPVRSPLHIEVKLRKGLSESLTDRYKAHRFAELARKLAALRTKSRSSRTSASGSTSRVSSSGSSSRVSFSGSGTSTSGSVSRGTSSSSSTSVRVSSGGTSVSTSGGGSVSVTRSGSSVSVSSTSSASSPGVSAGTSSSGGGTSAGGSGSASGSASGTGSPASGSGAASGTASTPAGVSVTGSASGTASGSLADLVRRLRSILP